MVLSNTGSSDAFACFLQMMFPKGRNAVVFPYTGFSYAYAWLAATDISYRASCCAQPNHIWPPACVAALALDKYSCTSPSYISEPGVGMCLRFIISYKVYIITR
jgi:hypothetical protein